MSELAGAMRFILARMEDPGLSPEDVRQFQTGVAALDNVRLRLGDLIEQHDNWQAADLELRRIEAGMAQFMDELDLSWPRLQSIIGPLCASGEPWTESLKADGGKLDQALAAQDPTGIRQYFRRYRRQAGERFYRVDLALKKLCDELRKVGDPLDLVLRTIE
jgi:hypothetical protein